MAINTINQPARKQSKSTMDVILEGINAAAAITGALKNVGVIQTPLEKANTRLAEAEATSVEKTGFRNQGERAQFDANRAQVRKGKMDEHIGRINSENDRRKQENKYLAPNKRLPMLPIPDFDEDGNPIHTQQSTIPLPPDGGIVGAVRTAQSQPAQPAPQLASPSPAADTASINNKSLAQRKFGGQSDYDLERTGKIQIAEEKESERQNLISKLEKAIQYDAMMTKLEKYRDLPAAGLENSRLTYEGFGLTWPGFATTGAGDDFRKAAIGFARIAKETSQNNTDKSVSGMTLEEFQDKISGRSKDPNSAKDAREERKKYIQNIQARLGLPRNFDNSQAVPAELNELDLKTPLDRYFSEDLPEKLWGPRSEVPRGRIIGPVGPAPLQGPQVPKQIKKKTGFVQERLLGGKK